MDTKIAICKTQISPSHVSFRSSQSLCANTFPASLKPCKDHPQWDFHVPSRTTDLGSFGSKENEDYKLQHSQRAYSSSSFLSYVQSRVQHFCWSYLWEPRKRDCLGLERRCEEKIHLSRAVQVLPNAETKYFKLHRVIKCIPRHFKRLAGYTQIFSCYRKPCRTHSLPVCIHI